MEQRNLVVALVLSVLVLVGWELYVSTGRETPPPAPAPGAPEAALAKAPLPEVAAPLPRAAAIAGTTRLRIAGKRVHGSLALKGARFDDLTLADYRETPDPASAEIALLSPPGSTAPYFAEFGWLDEQGRDVAQEAEWTSATASLANGTPAILAWRSPQGLAITRTVAVDDDFLFTITDRVVNEGQAAANLTPYGRVRRIGRPSTLGYFILHEGPVGVFGGTLKEVDYDDLEGQPAIEAKSTGGWIGFTDKYWLAAAIPDQQEPVTARYRHALAGTVDTYAVETIGQARRLEPGATVEVTQRLFAGAKEVRLLDRYREQPGIDRLDLAIDFGWFFYITKPMFYALLYLNQLLGNFGLAILAFTVFVKLVFYPLANKSYRSMSRMKALQPKLLELRERFGEDKQRQQQEMMALYKRENVNPLSGCLPMIVQIPVFFALYKVLFVTIEMRHAPFYGWIADLSAVDPTTLFNLFGLIPWDPPALLHIGAWPLLMGATMFLQQKLNPPPPDPVQAKLFMLMPVIFTVMLAPFPAGLVIYWAWNNLLSITQQYVIMRRMGVPIGNPPAPAPTPAAAERKAGGSGAEK